MESHALVKDNLNDPVTKYMKTDFARIRVDQTIDEALSVVRKNPPEGQILYFYVIDKDNRLEGVVPTRRFLLNSPEKQIGEIMVTSTITVPAAATVREACEFFTRHRLLAFPVVDAEQRMIGIVDVELYTSELSDIEGRQRHDELFQLIGVHLSNAEQASPIIAFRSRFPWLLANIGGGILAAFMSGVFEAELQKVVSLAMFIPVVLALAESVSIQSVSLALQSLHGENPTLKSLVKKLQTEISTGLFLGLACSVTVGIVALVWLRQFRVVICLMGGIVGGVIFAAVVGMTIPNLLRLFRRDPRVAAGPIALAAADMVTLFIYFSLARWMLR
jgi:magnesium transporter